MEYEHSDSEREPFSSGSSDNYEPENSSNSSSDENQETAAVQRCKRQKKSHPEMWKRNIRKKELASGEEHINSVNKLVAARTIGKDCKCRKKCFLKVNQEKQQQILQKFNELGEYSVQNQYLAGLVTSTIPVRSRPRTGSRRAKSASNKYKVKSVLC